VLLPLGALGLYLQVGDPRAAASLAQSRPDTHAGKGIDADAMVARLAERLQQAPDDLEGWMVLARSREVQEDFAAAAQAYQRAAELAARQQAPAELQARLLADLADALASAHGGALDGPVQAALDAALALHPDQPKALALAGTAAARRGDRDAARRHWGRLLPLLEPDSDIALRLRNGIGSLDGGAAAKESPAPASPY
jgi:cytochrome c-type biogenesis protein CcmH